MKTKSTTFYGKAQRSKTLDLRDIRGKIHDMPLILTEFILALLCNRDGNLSSIHRHMKNHHNLVVEFLGLVSAKKNNISLSITYIIE
jgi:hypothetical protein